MKLGPDTHEHRQTLVTGFSKDKDHLGSPERKNTEAHMKSGQEGPGSAPGANIRGQSSFTADREDVPEMREKATLVLATFIIK